MKRSELAQRNDQIVSLLLQGVHPDDISIQFGIGYGRVRDIYANVTGERFRDRPARTIRKNGHSTIHRNAQIVQRVVDDGMTLGEVASEYGITRQRVSQLCKSAGVSVRVMRRKRSAIPRQTCAVCGNTHLSQKTKTGTCSNKCAGQLRLKPVVDGKMQCTRCNLWLEPSQFYRRDGDKYYPRCRSCHRQIISDLAKRRTTEDDRLKCCERGGCTGSFSAWGNKQQRFCSRRCASLENQRLQRGWFKHVRNTYDD